MGTAKSFRHAGRGHHRGRRARHAAPTRGSVDYAAHIGRVGALAVALGIGAAVASTPGVAWAEGPEDNKPPAQETNDTTPPDPSPPNAAAAEEKPDFGEAIRRNLDRAADDIRKALTGAVRSSGGAHTSTHGTGTQNGNIAEVIEDDAGLPDKSPPSGKDQQQSQTQRRFAQNRHQNPATTATAAATATPRQFSSAAAEVVTPVHRAVEDVNGALHTTAQRTTAAVTPATNGSTDPGMAAARFSTDTDDALQISAAPEPGPVIRVVSSLLTAIGFGPAAINSPVAPVSGPTLLGALGLIRRELEHLFLNKVPDVASAATSLLVDQDEDITFTATAIDADGERLATLAVATVVDPEREAYLQQFRSADPFDRFFTPASPGYVAPDGQNVQPIEEAVALYGTAGFSRNAQRNLVYTNTTNEDVGILYGPDPGAEALGIRVVRPGQSVTLPTAGSYALAQHPKAGAAIKTVAVAGPGFPANGSGQSGNPLANLVSAVAQNLNYQATLARNLSNAIAGTLRQAVGSIVNVLFPPKPVGSVVRVETPTTINGIWDRLSAKTTGSLTDGIYIDKVKSAQDGQEKLVVYIGGTTAGPFNQSIYQNTVGWSGTPKALQVARILAARGAGNPNMEIMLVGYSQGGMDAQNIAAYAKALGLNVTTVVTFGSPIIQDYPGKSAPYKIVHLGAYKDPVVDWGRPGARDEARRDGILYQTTTATGDNFWANVNGFGVVHSDSATYREVGKKFESDKSPQFEETKKSIDRFEGQYVGHY